jgi:hypothetical protein
MSVIRAVTIKAKKYLETPEILIFVGPRQAEKPPFFISWKKEIKTAYFFS